MFILRGAAEVQGLAAVRPAGRAGRGEEGEVRVSIEVTLGPGALSTCLLAYPPTKKQVINDLGVGGKHSLRTACNM